MSERDVEKRLLEWAYEKFYPGWAEPSPSMVLGRLMDVGKDARRRKKRGTVEMRRKKPRHSVPCTETRGIRMEIIVQGGESTAVPPDGGMAYMINRMASSVERSIRCRILGEILDLMPRELYAVVHQTYVNCATPRDVPRRAKAAAEAIGIAERTYFKRKRAMFEWLAKHLLLPVDKAA